MELKPNSVLCWTNVCTGKHNDEAHRYPFLPGACLCILLLYFKSRPSGEKEMTWRWLQSCLVVFLYTVYWVVTDTLHLIRVINTLCLEDMGLSDLTKTFCNEYTCTLSRKVHAVCLYVKAPVWYVIAFGFLKFKPLLFTKHYAGKIDKQ